MAALTIQSISATGVGPTYAAAAGGGDTFAPTDMTKHFLHVKNGGGGSINVVIDDPTSATPTGATAFNPDTTTAVPNGGERMIAVDPSRFRDNATGNVSITYSGVTSVTIGVFKVP